MKRILFILRSTPYGSSKAQEGIESILAASVFDQHITVLFMDEGVWQLHKRQQSLGVEADGLHIKKEHKNIAFQLESFPLYEINEIFVDRKALDKFNLDGNDLILEPERVNDLKIQNLIRDSNVVLTY